MQPTKPMLTATVVVSALIFSGTAAAERADRAKSVEIEGARSVNKLDESTGSLEDAVLIQGTLKITAPKLTYRRDAKGNLFAELVGSETQLVTFREKREGFADYTEGQAVKVDYDQRADTIKLISRARVVSGGSLLTSDLIVYNTLTNEFQAGLPAGAKPSTGAASERVRIVLPPPVSDKPAEKK